jgi:hypothetical protein
MLEVVSELLRTEPSAPRAHRFVVSTAAGLVHFVPACATAGASANNGSIIAIFASFM